MSPLIGPLSKRGNSQNRERLFPFELLAIQNAILNYPKKVTSIMLYTGTYNTLYYWSEPVFNVIEECTVVIQKIRGPPSKCPLLCSITQLFMYQQFLYH